MRKIRIKKKKPLFHEFIPLQLCKPGKVPLGNDWVHEVKLDGYRIEAILNQGNVRLLSRNQIDWTDRFSHIVTSLSGLPVRNAVLDGEIVALDSNGISRFQMLQNALDSQKSADLIYYVIDIMYVNGKDVRNISLIERKKIIEDIMSQWPAKQNNIRVSEFIVGEGPFLFDNACRHGLEGIISKRAESLYVSTRNSDWIKIKCFYEEEFVIGGFTDPKGSREYFGSLALGYFDNNKLVYCGNVGTGFNESRLKKLYTLLTKREQKTCPYNIKPSLAMHWVQPELIAQIRFSEWTSDNILRQPVFLGLREDKSAEEVNRPPIKAAGRRSLGKKSPRETKTNTVKVANVIITNPDKKLYIRPPVSKIDMAQFYFLISKWILPYIKNRPLSLLRCPDGVEKTCFFQKHFTEVLPNILSIQVPGDNEPYVMINDTPGLIALIQMGVVEIHPWNSNASSLRKPDQMIFDLDPAEDVSFRYVKDCALLLREMLLACSLESFVKTSGGKGLHVVVPLTPTANHSEVTQFAKMLAEQLAQEFPERYIITPSKAKRRGKIFIDYLRNPQGSTAIAPYCTRAREGAPVSVPLAWDELRCVSGSKKYTIKNILFRLIHLKKDPWYRFFKIKQKLPKLPES